MLDDVKKNYNLIRILIILLIIAVGSYVLTLVWEIISLFLDILIILLISWLLSFILEPVVDAIQKFIKISKLVSTIITYILLSILFTVISVGYIPLVSSQISILAINVPHYLESAPKIIATWTTLFINQLGSSATLIPSVAQFLFSAFIVLILSFYFIVDKEKINQELFKLVPKNWHAILHFTQKVINDTFVSFLRVQLFFGISSALVTWLILIIFNIDFAASIAFLAGIFAIIPLVGPLLAIIPPVLIALLADPLKAVIIGAILLLIQQITFNVIGPKLLGQAFKLHPAIILISFLVGLKFAGGLGAVFAIPVLGISAVMIRRFGHYFLKITEETTKTIQSS